MKASVQYNDIIGTVAADVSDWYSNSLQVFLERSFKCFDGDRFSCRGCTGYIGEGGHVYVTFICLDKVNDEFVRFETKEFWNLEDFFSMFKRFDIVMGKDIDELPEKAELKTYLLEDGKDKG